MTLYTAMTLYTDMCTVSPNASLLPLLFAQEVRLSIAYVACSNKVPLHLYKKDDSSYLLSLPFQKSGFHFTMESSTMLLFTFPRTMARLSCCLRLFKTQGSASPWKLTQGSSERWLVLADVFAFSRLRVPLHHASIHKVPLHLYKKDGSS